MKIKNKLKDDLHYERLLRSLSTLARNDIQCMTSSWPSYCSCFSVLVNQMFYTEDTNSMSLRGGFATKQSGFWRKHRLLRKASQRHSWLVMSSISLITTLVVFFVYFVVKWIKFETVIIWRKNERNNGCFQCEEFWRQW